MRHITLTTLYTQAHSRHSRVHPFYRLILPFSSSFAMCEIEKDEASFLHTTSGLLIFDIRFYHAIILRHILQLDI